MPRKRRRKGAQQTKVGEEVEEVVEEVGENLGRRRGGRRHGDGDGAGDRDGTDTTAADTNATATPPGPVKLTKAGQRKIGNLGEYKDVPAGDAIKARGGGQAQVNMVDREYQNLSVGELANRAAAGDEKAETAMKMIKQASSKRDKYGRGGH